MDTFNFADALLGILAQRLAKELCGCKQAYTPDAQQLKAFVWEYAEELRHTDAWKADPGGEAQRLLERLAPAIRPARPVHAVTGGGLRQMRPVGLQRPNRPA